jgi:hypothetical protein
VAQVSYSAIRLLQSGGSSLRAMRVHRQRTEICHSLKDGSDVGRQRQLRSRFGIRSVTGAWNSEVCGQCAGADGTQAGRFIGWILCHSASNVQKACTVDAK